MFLTTSSVDSQVLIKLRAPKLVHTCLMKHCNCISTCTSFEKPMLSLILADYGYSKDFTFISTVERAYRLRSNSFSSKLQGALREDRDVCRVLWDGLQQGGLRTSKV